MRGEAWLARFVFWLPPSAIRCLTKLRRAPPRHRHCTALQVHAVIGVNPNKAYAVPPEERKRLLEGMLAEMGVDAAAVKVVICSDYIWQHGKRVGATVSERGPARCRRPAGAAIALHPALAGENLHKAAVVNRATTRALADWWPPAPGRPHRRSGPYQR